MTEVRRDMSTVVDTTRTQAFAEQALGIVNGGFLSLMLSVGHRTGLLDTLVTLEPATSDRIAAAAGLNERYVRERLGAMVRPNHRVRPGDALRPGGVFLMVDIAASSQLERNLDNPLAPFLFTVSTMHCMTVSLAQDGEGLGACWGEEKARELVMEAGFASDDVSRVEGDPLNAYYVCRP
jgi:hypothetical protein